jgi:acid phosphatase type 7
MKHVPALVAAVLGCALLGIVVTATTTGGSADTAVAATTATSPGKVVLAAGDIQATKTTNPTEAILDANPHDALFALGDNQYESGTLSAFNSYYSQTWGDAADKPKTYPIPGNHEHRSSLASNYCAYFRKGKNGRAAIDPCAKSTSAPYWAATIGDWRVLGFDTGSSSGGGDLTATQASFLRQELARDTHKCEVVLLHHPRYNGGSHGPSPKLADNWQDMMNAGVDLVLSGHDHNYQRYAKMNGTGGVDTQKGIPLFVVGTGGKSNYALKTRPSGLQASNATTDGVLKLTLKSAGYDWNFLPEKGKTYTDSGSGTCR